MKKIFILFIMLLPFLATAQPVTEGMVQYLVTHNWTKKMAALTYITPQQKAKQAYMWGSRSEWKSYANLYFTATETKYEDSEEKAERSQEGGYDWRKETFFIRRNFEKSTLQEAYELLGKTYIVEDTLLAMNWKIQNDLKEVAGHICMKAFIEDTFKKQQIVAWFAQDIPLNAGPERFHSLPGMILEIDINDGAMLITANRIDVKKLTTELEVPKKLKGKKIKTPDYDKLIKTHITDRTKEEQPWFWGIRY
jgi:GLPGLI family protein